MFPGSSLADAAVAYPVSTGGNELAIRRDAFHQQFAADVPAAQAAVVGRRNARPPKPPCQNACPPTPRRGDTSRPGSSSATRT
jgi:hypothetical protein